MACATGNCRDADLSFRSYVLQICGRTATAVDCLQRPLAYGSSPSTSFRVKGGCSGKAVTGSRVSRAV